MKKTIDLEWGSFMNGDIVTKEKRRPLIPSLISGTFMISKATVVLAAVPGADSTGLARLMFELLGVADYIAWGGFIFAGASWMFNNRTVAIERGIGVTAGYLIIRKAWDFVIFLKGV
ncbi:hypothetical protein QFZ28_006027 [Neobacillus niacini]|uniref:hypothetical protein n=1 Tax=Neobacillus niacini TaxID=86668 RepID=UPI0027840454|nr:hypothetical protein [Neobacillus niacini]MDQ1005449.1 hypothetical protein [Neobacillus niacini]